MIESFNSMKTTIRSRAPLRLGLGGGGTDVAPYSELYGGAVLNATINLYAHCSIELGNDDLQFEALDFKEKHMSTPKFQKLSNPLILHKAVYNRIMIDFNNSRFIPLKISTSCDAPLGSGLGSSSTIVVAMIKAYQHLLQLKLTEYQIAELAFDIERNQCNLLGGKQDQYSATFGGLNFIEFRANEQAIVNSLRLREPVINELEESMLLFYTGISRSSATIISDQTKFQKSPDSVNAMHTIKKTGIEMKDALMKDDLQSFFSIQKSAWSAKKASSSFVSNTLIDSISKDVNAEHAYGLKVSGAGGGGFIIIYCNPLKRVKIQTEIERKYDINVFKFSFTFTGATSWSAR
jgi:D-glycero-alpha-D-manno-heptose-7-phosphate kinase